MKTNKKQNLFATILSVILLVAFFAISALLNLGPAAKNTVATNSDRKSGTFLLSDSDDEMPKPVENPPATILVSVQNGTSGYADSIPQK